MIREMADGAGTTRTLLSAEPTIELLGRARAGDQGAIEALLERCLPELRRWAHGRLPAAARAALDTSDLVQDAAIHALNHLDTFQPRHVGAMQAYLRRSVVNRIIDEVRRVKRRPVALELDSIEHEISSGDDSPLELAIAAQTFESYRTAIATLKVRDRELVVARVELQWPIRDIAKRFGFATTEGARMAVTRALKKLAGQMKVSAGT